MQDKNTAAGCLCAALREGLGGVQLTGGTAVVGGVAATAADLEPLRVGTLLRTWQPGTAARLGLAFFCARRREKGARMSWNTVLLLAARHRQTLSAPPVLSLSELAFLWGVYPGHHSCKKLFQSHVGLGDICFNQEPAYASRARQRQPRPMQL